MQFKMLNIILKTTAVAGLLLTASLSSAQAPTDVYLKVEQFAKQISDGNGGFIPVEMWGFANCDSTFTNCDDPVSPGPQINAVAGQMVTIHVSNTLPKMPVSIVIPGQGGGDPRWMPSPDGRGQPDRVKSMTHEAAPNDGLGDGTAEYPFTFSKPGTYLYQSGSYASLEVPMGLYGAVVVSSTVTGCAYGDAVDLDPDSCFEGESVLLFSEVDPIQNERVNDAIDPNVGALDPTTACIPMVQYIARLDVGFPCTLDYNPSYLLVNGEPSTDLGAAAAGLDAGSPILLRMINAGLRSHTPSIVGVEMRLLAEDGNRYPGAVPRQNAVLLAAGKTIDAIIPASGDAATNVSFFDRMPTFSNENAPNGGSLGTVFGPGMIPPDFSTLTANPDNFAFDENNSLVGKSVLDNDIGASGASVSLNGAVTAVDAGGATITPGPLVLDAGGTLSYTAGANEVSTVTVPYTASVDGRSGSSIATISVSFANGAPVAKNDSYTNAVGPNIVVAAPGVLANDSDPDGDTLVASLVSGPAGTLSCVTVDPATSATITTPGLCADGSFVFEPASPGDDVFTYAATDGNGTPVEAVVALHTNAVSGIKLSVVDETNTGVTDFRWTIEQDDMWQPNPNAAQPPEVTQGANFHKSYMPVIAQGSGAAEFAQLALDPTKHYYVSVLPAGDATSGTDWVLTHGMGGARILPGQNIVTVNVNSQPTPYAQISIFVFNDNWPTNGSVDGNEQGIGGFQVSLEDAGGRYGASAGMMSQDADGNPLRNSLPCFGPTFDQEQPQAGIILSCPEGSATPGEVLITNLWPGKYGVIVTPPTNESTDWVQTSTIEGTKVIDAWVKAAEPAFFQEFGPAGWHVFTGFVKPAALVAPPSDAMTSISGKVTNLHMSRPPNQNLVDSDSYNALAHTRAWVGVNSDAGVGPNIAAVQAEPDGTFMIDGIPAGQNYQLVVWDTYLDQVIAFQGVSTPAADAAGAVAPVPVGNVPVFQWFARLENTVFLDENGDGVLPRDAATGDPLEPVLPEQNVNIRWRDGTVYAAAPTDTEGFVPFDQVFPFFHWLVAEVDYARFKPTGITATPDGGGVTDADGILNPNWPDNTPTTFTTKGPVLTQGFQAFLGQTNVIEWGKKPWLEGENGGISGIVYYASTRAENDPRLGVGEVWEPGVPGVTVRLYKEVVRPDGVTALALIDETQTDSWDDPDSLPSACPGAHSSDELIVGTGPTGANDKCYDGLRNFNQVRDAVFDGGYAFGAECDLGVEGSCLEPGKYVVEIIPPPGYEIVKEQDVNVGFGEGFGVAAVTIPLPSGGLVLTPPDLATVAAAMAAEPGLAQPPCVGALHDVPETLSLFPSAQVEAPFAGAQRPLCDRKEVVLSDQGQAAADFWLFTGAPISGHFVGMILDDTAQEFNPLSIQFGEKWAPPFVPVSVRDYLGREISRTYSDQWGRMNALVPSTFSANLPSPSGYSPSMLMTCMNDPGPIVDPDPLSSTYGTPIIDPQYNPAYSNFCYTFQYMPGTTTYLDTPVVPVSAFASGYSPPDCQPADGEPRISWVDVDGIPGPYAAVSDTVGATLTIHAQGYGVVVPNPEYEGPDGTGAAAGAPKNITRDFVFGPDAGTVTLGGTTMTGVAWGDTEITVEIPPGGDANALAAGAHQLVVTNAAGVSTTEGVTVYIDDASNPQYTVATVTENQSIQDAIDTAAAGDLIIVGPGTYEEMLIMWKPVILQGAGAGVTFINGAKRPTDSLLDWRAKMDCLFGVSAAGCNGATFDAVDALPNQAPGAAGFDTEEGAPITVVGVFDPGNGRRPTNSFRRGPGQHSRIDGFSITGGDTGGGIFVNGNAHRLSITNNRIFGNAGSWHGGIRVGRPFLELPEPTIGNNPPTYAFNIDVHIEHNAITQNGGMDGAGGGISVMTGTDDYRITSNFVCGNFTQGDGGGIGHLGLSNGGRIEFNKIAFNQSFFQQTTVSGGGIFIGGEPGAVVGDVSYGAGQVFILDNLIQGNEAASGHGGGIRTQYVNGFDVANDSRSNRWYEIRIRRNTIVNNVAGWSGGGISMHDTARGDIRNNVIAHNDSTATVAATFSDGPDAPSVNQPAGLSSEPHSLALAGVLPGSAPLFSSPDMRSNRFFENRSFHYEVVDVNGIGTAMLLPNLDQGSVGQCVSGANIIDLGVLGNNSYTLSPGTSTFTDPGFAEAICNGGRSLLNPPGPMYALPAIDEGGATWIQVRFGPLQLRGDYTY